MFSLCHLLLSIPFDPHIVTTLFFSFTIFQQSPPTPLPFFFLLNETCNVSFKRNSVRVFQMHLQLNHQKSFCNHCLAARGPWQLLLSPLTGSQDVLGCLCSGLPAGGRHFPAAAGGWSRALTGTMFTSWPGAQVPALLIGTWAHSPVLRFSTCKPGCYPLLVISLCFIHLKLKTGIK